MPLIQYKEIHCPNCGEFKYSHVMQNAYKPKLTACPQCGDRQTIIFQLEEGWQPKKHATEMVEWKQEFK